jgi:predicted phosphodiesterase
MRWVVISDLQVPDHDQKAVDLVARFIQDTDPDGLLCVGDEADQPEPSRWNRQMAGEYAGTLQKGLDRTHQVLAQLREAVGDKPFHLMRSNHTQRIDTYIKRYAPALSSLRDIEYTKLVGLDELSITWHTRPFTFTPGFVLAHGDEGSLSRIAGSTAMGLARKWGYSVVCGHTHRLGLQHDHRTLNGRITRYLWGMEVGCLMDMRKADYLGPGMSANWTQGVGIIDNGIPELVPIVGHKIRYGGQEWS